jgi:probable phosphoglycerate mutase
VENGQVFEFNKLPVFSESNQTLSPRATHLFLIRHGQSEGNASGCFGGHSLTPLSSLGRKQADATAKLLYKEGVSAIYSSDLPRTVQTAEPLARLTGMEVETTSALRERNVGILQGLSFEEAAEKHPIEYNALLQRNLDFQMPEGESYRQLIQRATNKLHQILEQNVGEKIAIYTHTGTICFLTLHLLGGLLSATPYPIWLITKNCGINRFEFRADGTMRVHALNDTRHLL